MKKIALLLGVIALWFSFAASPARATNVNIDGLPAASSVAGGNLWECEQGGINNQCTSAQVAAYVYSLASGDCTITGVGAVVCTKTNGVSFSALATTVPATGIATWIGTPSSANLLAAMTDKTGTGTLVFGTAPTISSLNATVAMTLAFITGSTQCLQVNTSGVVSGTGAACGSGGGGAVSSVTGGIGVTVTPTTGAVVVSAPVVTRNNTATTDTITNSDRGTIITENNASPVAVSITTSGFVATDYITVKNLGAGLATYTPTSGNIDGFGTMTVKQNWSTDVYFDGTNWWTLGGKPINVACADLSNGGTACAAATGASGHALPFLDIANTWTGQQTFNTSAPIFGTITGSTQCLHVNSSGLLSGTGSDCGAGGGGAANHPGYKASNWYLGLDQTTRNGGAGINLLTAYCSIMHIGGTSSATIEALATNINAGAASSHIQLAIYNNDFSSGIARPGTLIDSTASISSASTGPVSGLLNATHSVAAGFYWSCVQADNNTVSVMANSTGLNGQQEMAMVGETGINNALANNFPDSVSTTTGISSFGTWPSPLTSTGIAFGHSVWIGFQFVSVP